MRAPMSESSPSDDQRIEVITSVQQLRVNGVWADEPMQPVDESRGSGPAHLQDVGIFTK